MAGTPSAVEANFDGIVGPTHNYSGLAMGNVAAEKNAEQASNPREAALQGLAKMKSLVDLGMLQGVLPPQERPHVPTLKRLGFSGRDREILARASHEAPELLAAMTSASSMWTANAATVSPSADTADNRIHLTPANLATHLHRAIEPEVTGRGLKVIFDDDRYFCHHDPIPATPQMGDEGAANHTRLCSDYGAAGVEIFVYGQAGERSPKPQRYPARQTLAASAAVARLHELAPERCVFLQQSPDVIDQGVFHNDVIAVGNRELLLYHENAFLDDADGLAELARRYGDSSFCLAKVGADELPVADAVQSYLFNSQLICPPDGKMWLVSAIEAQENDRARRTIERLVEDPTNPIAGVLTFDLRQSMRNGGGPACLRLRVVLNEAERAAVHPGCWLTDALYQQLGDWVRKHYRDRLMMADLADPSLLEESRTALDALTQILGLGSLYDFQR